MRPSRRLYIALCQRLLAVGVVVVALVPASGVVSLDVVGVAPTTPVVPRQPLAPSVPAAVTEGRPMDHADALPAYTEETTHESEVPTAPVDPVVTRGRADPEDGDDRGRDGQAGRDRRAGRGRRAGRPGHAGEEGAAVDDRGRERAAGRHRPRHGRRHLGQQRAQVADDAITVQVRTEQDGVWSEWSDLDLPRGARTRPGQRGGPEAPDPAPTAPSSARSTTSRSGSR